MPVHARVYHTKTATEMRSWVINLHDLKQYEYYRTINTKSVGLLVYAVGR
jgi:hypothetical protein